jgi:hypothetical protein
MVRIQAKSVAHFVDEFDFSGVSNAADLQFSETPGEVTAFADLDGTFVEGKATFVWNINGMFSTSSPNYDGETFIDLTSTQRRVGVYPGGDTEGTFGYEGRSNITDRPIVAETASAIALNVSWLGDQAVVRGALIFKNTAVSSTATGTKFQVGAVAATQTAVGVLRLLAAPGGSGSNDCVVTIESDPNSSAGGETTRLTFTTLNQASVALHEVKEATGAFTDAWWRAVVTISGGGSRTFNLVITFGERETDG